MNAIVNLIKDDWQRTPLTYRYVFYTGIFFIAIAWLTDILELQHYWDTQSRQISFVFGFSLIIIFFAILLVRQIYLSQKIFRLRHKYLNDLHEKYHLISFAGWVYLYDMDNKQRLHVKNWQTASDLGFINEWTETTTHHDAEEGEIIVKDGTTIKLKDWKTVPGGIHTQGIVGT